MRRYKSLFHHPKFLGRWLLLLPLTYGFMKLGLGWVHSGVLLGAWFVLGVLIQWLLNRPQQNDYLPEQDDELVLSREYFGAKREPQAVQNSTGSKH